LLDLLNTNNGYVDVYFNDLFGLKKSIENISQSSLSQIIGSKNNKINLFQEFDFFRLKYALWNKQYDDFFYIWRIVRKNHYF
jgi:hypothetical protein